MNIGNNIVDNTTHGVVASMATSPVWLPWLQTVSETAALLAPVLGGIWIGVQIVAKIKEMATHDD